MGDDPGDANYFDVERQTKEWEVDVPYYRRPMSEILNPLWRLAFASTAPSSHSRRQHSMRNGRSAPGKSHETRSFPASGRDASEQFRGGAPGLKSRGTSGPSDHSNGPPAREKRAQGFRPRRKHKQVGWGGQSGTEGPAGSRP